jgi:uncharacterized protein (TIGR02996 family)
VTVDFEAKARELLAVLPARPHVTGAVEILAVADALRAAALDEGAREAARAELARLLADVRGQAMRPSLTVSVDPGAAVPWDAPTQPTPQADMEAMLSAAVFNAATSLTILPDSAFARLLERICWLLNLSGGERRFVAALAQDAGDFDTAQVYADWLLDQGRTADGARVRRLVPQDGDVLVWQIPNLAVAARQERVYLAGAEYVRNELNARGINTTAVFLPDGADLSALDPDAMRAAGWVRAGDVANRLADLAGDLGDCWGPGTARMIARHFNDLFDPPVPPAPEAPP